MVTGTKRWTLEELHSLPDDGNKYELVRGELFVTPAPSTGHETILARLSRILESYIAAHSLGFVYHPRAVVRFEGSEVEPDLMVRAPPTDATITWDDWPMPILVVEVLSDTTRRRDHMQKRALYMDADIAEYWIVDPERRCITSVKRPGEEQVYDDQMTWQPDGATGPLVFALSAVFG